MTGCPVKISALWFCIGFCFQVVPCAWTKFEKPSLLMISVVFTFYAVIGVSAIVFNSFVLFLYIRSLKNSFIVHRT